MENFEKYFDHLRNISLFGKVYKKYYASQVLFYQARRFGQKIAEIGSGVGNGILGAYPSKVTGYEINPLAVDYCKNKKLNAFLISESFQYPIENEVFDVCVLDNVLEHIENPKQTLDECYRITRKSGGLIIVVPGLKGFRADSDHKFFYGEVELKILDERWQLLNVFSIPLFIKSHWLSERVRQYCLIAVYRKI